MGPDGESVARAEVEGISSGALEFSERRLTQTSCKWRGDRRDPDLLREENPGTFI